MSRPPTAASPLKLHSHALQRMGDGLSVRSVDFRGAAASGLSVFGLDHFQVSGQPFGPHPHAGFSAITYVLPESPGGLRSCDSGGGGDVVVGPGGIVWLEAGSGAIHEELPARPGVALLAYVMQGDVRLRCGPLDMALQPGQAVTLVASGSPLAFQADVPSRMVLLSSPAIHEPMVAHGPFVMNDEAQLREAVHRYRSGGMGSLAPAPQR